MRNFIRNIIDRLCGIIHSDAHDATEPTVNDFTNPSETGFDVDHRRYGTVVLTPSGIRFCGIRYNSPAVVEILGRMKSGSRVKVMMDPRDYSSIFVWDSTARPTPRWITVNTADAPTQPSFAQIARPRNFPKAQEHAFSRADWSDARERLNRHWQKLTEQPPIRESRSARPPGNVTRDGIDLIGGRLAQIEEVLLAQKTLPRSRKPSKAALAKAKRMKMAMAEAKTNGATQVSLEDRK
jgi:hypothetical protein